MPFVHWNLIQPIMIDNPVVFISVAASALTIAVTSIGMLIRLNSRIDKLEFRAEAIEKATNDDREAFRKAIEKLSGDMTHLEKHIGQMQTNIRVFIQEQSREMHEAMEKLHDKIDHLKEEHYKYKIEITEKLK